MVMSAAILTSSELRFIKEKRKFFRFYRHLKLNQHVNIQSSLSLSYRLIHFQMLLILFTLIFLHRFEIMWTQPYHIPTMCAGGGAAVGEFYENNTWGIIKSESAPC